MTDTAPPFDLIDAARDLIGANSVSANGNLEALAILRPLMERVGLTVELREAEALGTAHANALGAHPRNPGTDGGLLLVTHSDTVDPGDPADWTETDHAPFTLTRKGDRLYGLGTADVKLDALCKLLALDRVRDRELARPVHVLFTFAEEVGLLGAKRFVADGDLRYAWASAGEPSELKIVHAHKGYVVLRLRLSDPGAPSVSGSGEARTLVGSTAHSSTPHLGDSAVERVLDLASGQHLPEGPPTPGLAAARNRSRAGRDLGRDDVHRHLGGAVTRVDGGTVANRVPDRCVLEVDGAGADHAALLALVCHLRAEWVDAVSALSPDEDARFDPASAVYNMGRLSLSEGHGEVLFDCRLLPGHDGEALARGFSRTAEAAARARGLSLSVDVERNAAPMAAPVEGTLVEAARATARAVGTPETPITKATNTEAGTLASTGAEAIVFGPGVSVGNVHRPNEYNLVSHLHTAVDFYERLILELCAA